MSNNDEDDPTAKRPTKFPSTPILDNDVITTGSKELLLLLMTTPPSVAQDIALAPSPHSCTSIDQDNTLTTPMDVDD